MDNARKLLLIEPRVLERAQAQDEYKELLKRPSTKLKANASRSMREILRSDEHMPDDLKAKAYRQQLNRFMNVKERLPEPLRLSRGVLPITSSLEPIEEEPPLLPVGAEIATRTRSEWMKKKRDFSRLLLEKEKEKANRADVELQQAAMSLIDNPQKAVRFHNVVEDYWHKKGKREEMEDEDDDDPFYEVEEPVKKRTMSLSATQRGKGIKWSKY